MGYIPMMDKIDCTGGLPPYMLRKTDYSRADMPILGIGDQVADGKIGGLDTLLLMPNKEGTGPRGKGKNAGTGGGKGNQGSGGGTNKGSSGQGPKSGGKKGSCQ